VLAGQGREQEAHEQLRIIAADSFAELPFDTNWLSAIGEAMERAAAPRRADCSTGTHRPDAYAGANSPPVAQSSRMVRGSQLGHAALVLGRRDEAIGHYEAAVRIDSAAGLVPWAERARHALAAAVLDD